MDPLTMSLLATAGSGLITKLLNPGKAYKKAGEASQQYFNQAQGHLQPYAKQGQEAYGNLQGAMQNLLNPEDLYSRFAQSYEASPATQYAQEEAQNQGLDTASAMGLSGSSPALRAIQAEKSRIGAQGRDSYINNLINQYLQGAHLSQGIYGQGANAAGQMSNNASNFGQMAGQTAYGQRAAPQNLFGSLLGTAAQGVGTYQAMKGWNPYGTNPHATPPIMPGQSPQWGGNY